jgi:phage-related protein
MIEIRFWKSANGREPVRDWLSLFDSNDKRTLGRDLAKVQFGWPIGMPVCRPMKEGLFEVRSSLPSAREARILFCFHNGSIIALHGFIKKSQATLQSEIELARQRMKELTKWLKWARQQLAAA